MRVIQAVCHCRQGNEQKIIGDMHILLTRHEIGSARIC